MFGILVLSDHLDSEVCHFPWRAEWN